MSDKGQIPRTMSNRYVGAPVPFARTSAFTPCIDFLDTIGTPTDQLLRQARIPAGLLDDPEALVPLFPIYRFMELAARQAHLEDLGVLIAEQTSAFDLGAYGVALRGASTVYQYLQTGIRLIGTLSSGTKFWLNTEGNIIRVNQYLIGPTGIGRCIADIYTLVLTINMLRRFVGPAWSPGEVRLMVGDEALLGDWEVLGNASLITGQDHSSFTIAHSLMKNPVLGGSKNGDEQEQLPKRRLLDARGFRDFH